MEQHERVDMAVLYTNYRQSEVIYSLLQFMGFNSRPKDDGVEMMHRHGFKVWIGPQSMEDGREPPMDHPVRVVVERMGWEEYQKEYERLPQAKN